MSHRREGRLEDMLIDVENLELAKLANVEQDPHEKKRCDTERQKDRLHLSQADVGRMLLRHCTSGQGSIRLRFSSRSKASLRYGWRRTEPHQVLYQRVRVWYLPSVFF